MSKSDVAQKNTETTLIERFLYPKLGPGQMWELVADIIQEKGGRIVLDSTASSITVEGNRVTAVEVVNFKTGEKTTYPADYVFSTMPMKELVTALKTDVPPKIKEISDGLVYRDFITVGLLVNKLLVKEKSTANSTGGDSGTSSSGGSSGGSNGNGSSAASSDAITDNWIYIQEPDVKLGRLQIFNNWSPYMVADPSKTWLGLEYFCDDTDDIWRWDDQTMTRFAGEELEKIGIIKREDIVDSVVIHMPKTYPGYFGTYYRFDELRAWIDKFENLFLVGRNGMHKYNNQDHSMLTAMVAVENIAQGVTNKDNLWSINTEMDYHEEKSTSK